MLLAHYPVNPEGKDLERVADVYVSKGFDILAKPNPSKELLALLAKGQLPGDIQDLMKQILRIED